MNSLLIAVKCCQPYLNPPLAAYCCSGGRNHCCLSMTVRFLLLLAAAACVCMHKLTQQAERGQAAAAAGLARQQLLSRAWRSWVVAWCRWDRIASCIQLTPGSPGRWSSCLCVCADCTILSVMIKRSVFDPGQACVAAGYFWQVGTCLNQCSSNNRSRMHGSDARAF
jgi:hypothetical protein